MSLWVSLIARKQVNQYVSCTNKRQKTHFLKIPGPNKIQTQCVNSKYKAVAFQTLSSWLRSADFTLVRLFCSPSHSGKLRISSFFPLQSRQQFLPTCSSPSVGISVLCNWPRPAFKPCTGFMKHPACLRRDSTTAVQMRVWRVHATGLVFTDSQLCTRSHK